MPDYGFHVVIATMISASARTTAKPNLLQFVTIGTT